MTDETNGTTAQTPAEGAAQAKAQSAAAPQGQASPEDRFAALEARFAKLEGLEKDLHAERTAHGRTRAQLRIAQGENGEAFNRAFNNYERAKATLLQQGYSEATIDRMAERDPESLSELAGRTAETPAPASKGDDLAALRAEIAALKAQQEGRLPAQPIGPRGGVVTQKSIQDLADGEWDPKAAQDTLRRLGVR